jgi:serine phosphatase RsbU (regulator of sigma subunit)/anti-sigma regulatory factor (Ser/Thr protein kinase)
MTSFLQNLWETFTGQREPAAAPAAGPAAAPAQRAQALALNMAPNDPLALYFQSSPGTVEIDKLNLDSPALAALKAAQVKLVVPLLSQGELIGVVSLGRRRSEQDYSTDDRTLLNNLATQAGPAVRVAQLVRQQQLEAQARERIELELRVAGLIQQTLLPREVPALPGWKVAAYYQPARAVGGDFYDFIQLADGRLGLVVGDVTDKGVPAALVMATTRALLRTAALQFDTPGQVLAQVNNLLCPDIPPKMFVTCLYGILDPQSGRLHYANAGHDLPYAWSENTAAELRARGMPLGLMSGMSYEEKDKLIAHGEGILFYSDGLVEAHNPQREMFGFPRLGQLLSGGAAKADVIEYLLAERNAFTGPSWEQEDDTTLVVLQRDAGLGPAAGAWQALGSFSIPSQPGNERDAMQRVTDLVAAWDVPAARLEKLKTAVGEGTMNAIEHGNQNRPDLNVDVTVLASQAPRALAVRISDHALSGGRPLAAATPDLDAKLAGLQSPRGWGLFLIEKMVDKMNVYQESGRHTLELILNLEEDGHGQ